MDVERQIFADTYKFLSENMPAQRDPWYWMEIVNQTSALEKKYKGNDFAKAMIYACTKRLCEQCDKGV